MYRTSSIIKLPGGLIYFKHILGGGRRSTPDRVVRVRGLGLAGDIVLCSWAKHFTLTVPLSTQVYKWVPANSMLGVTLRWTSIPSRGSRNTPSRFMLQKPEISAGLMGLLCSNADFTFFYILGGGGGLKREG